MSMHEAAMMNNQHEMNAQEHLAAEPEYAADLQEEEIAEMLKARIKSGKSASTSSSLTGGKAGVEDDSIFADLDTNGILSHCVM